MIIGLIILSSKIALSDEPLSQNIISNKALVSYLKSNGDRIIIESVPGGNSMPGAGCGTPVITIVHLPGESLTVTNQKAQE
jgi:hypothetical protein